MAEVRGPKPKSPSAVKRNSFTFRIRETLREQIIAAAAENGRSMSEEAESRLAGTFEGDSIAETILRRLREEKVI